MRAAALVVVALLAVPTAADAAKPDRTERLKVVDREVLASPSTGCAEVPQTLGAHVLRPGAEASPALTTDGRSVRAVWQQDVGHPAGGSITTFAASLSSGLGGLCGTSPEGARGGSVTLPSVARGSDGRVWTATSEFGPERVRVLLSDGSRTVLVEDLPASPPGNVEALPVTVAVDPADPDRVHVAYPLNLFPAGTVSTHREVDAASGTVSAPHPFWYGATPALYDFREQLVALGGEDLLALSTEVDPAGLPTLAPSYLDRQDLTQAPVVVRARRSADAGVTWSAPQVVLTLANGAVRDPQGGTALRSLVHPSVAVGPDGRLHVAAESVGTTGTEVLVASSADDGATWTTAVAARRPATALNAAVAVDGDGRLAVSWLDVAGDLGATWRAALAGSDRVVDLSRRFDLRALAPAYVGDQGALVGLDRGFAALTVVGTGSDADPADVVLLRLR